MTYQEATEYLFDSAPLFQNIGAGAYKEGLTTTKLLDEHFNHPHQSFRTIHVAGTNGKGSCCHTLASILQEAGYKVGLYTSPHLVDFRERIRVNGKMIPQQRVVDFVEQEKSFFEPLHPSFFELATALAFLYFREEKIDVALVEVGLGGRLDCTNIIHPDLSIITNISFDHTQFLGDTLEKIAGEKAGIIKPHVPVIIGETNGHAEVKKTFWNNALSNNSKIVFAEERDEIKSSGQNPSGGRTYQTHHWGQLEGELGGLCQEKNTSTILAAIPELREAGYRISDDDVRQGFLHVCENTGLLGRWQKLSQDPLIICDTGHNVGGMQYIIEQLETTPHRKLHIIIGMVSDKDITTVLSMLPKEAHYYFTQASVKRAMPAAQFATKARNAGLYGEEYENVSAAYYAAFRNLKKDDLLFIGGSNFIVADMLKNTL